MPWRSRAASVVLCFGSAFLVGCSDSALAPTATMRAVPSVRADAALIGVADVRGAIQAQERHTEALMRIPGVVGTAVGVLPSGKVGVKILVSAPGLAGLPAVLEGIPVAVQVTGQLVAFSDPTTRQRPAPLGFSVGHPSITAGTIGALVRNAAGDRFILSNNHVLANSNNATIGDATLQPGPFDGGTAADQIGTLAAFKAISFAANASNTMDAAIARSDEVSNSTPTDDGYGAPSTSIWGDANADGTFDDKAAALNLAVQKFGRTTKLTKGTITGINATVTICYEPVFIFCLRSARFVDQFIIEPGTFSGGGDSGSLIVTDDAGKNPVALLFAGSTAQTIANRIDLVLAEFGVTIDGGTSPPPTPVTDVAITGVSAPASVTEGSSANVVVTVRNVGNQNVGSTFNVSLLDATDNVPVGSPQTVAGLAAGATVTRTFVWNTTGRSLGPHTLTASHDLADNQASNNQASATSTVSSTSTPTGMHVGNLDAITSSNATTWSATVEITVHDSNHQPLNGVTVVGTWSRSGLNSDTCTSGDLGGNGTCIVLFPSLSQRNVKSVTFSVSSLTKTGTTYQATQNHDPDGSSNGTSIKVNRP